MRDEAVYYLYMMNFLGSRVYSTDYQGLRLRVSRAHAETWASNNTDQPIFVYGSERVDEQLDG